MRRLGAGAGTACGRTTVLLLAALALVGCETTAEKSAKLQRQAKRVTLSHRGLTIARLSSAVTVVSAALLHGAEGVAAVVTLHNRSSRTLSDVPIAITVANARGRTLFQNDGPGLEAALVSVPSIGPRRSLVWVNDQVPANGDPASVAARVGDAPAVAGNVPQLSIAGARLGEDPASGPDATGTVENSSAIPQRNLVIFGVARRDGKIVAAGRGVLPVLAARGSQPFQLFLIGDARGAQLQISVPPTSFR
jgi:hypothetical protein